MIGLPFKDAATPDTQRPGGRPPALGELPGGLTAKDYFAK